jgi:5-methyltetrahydropteroyltriglutamate--homocysteine methyltransferase
LGAIRRSIDGFVIKPAAFKFGDDRGHEMDFTAPYAKGKLRRVQPLAPDEFPARCHEGNAKNHAAFTIDDAFLLLYGLRRPGTNIESFFADLCLVFRNEIADLANGGCRHIQLDEVAVALLCDPAIRETIEDAGQDPDYLVDLYIDSINEAMAGAPADVSIGVQICRGNFKGHYLASGGYESVAERFFSRTRVNHFLLEYDTERAGDFKPFRFVKDKGVVLGLVNECRTEVHLWITLIPAALKAGICSGCGPRSQQPQPHLPG